MYRRAAITLRRAAAGLSLLAAALAAGCLGRGGNQGEAVVDAGYLLRVATDGEEDYGLGSPSFYVNERGDTIVAPGKYLYCYNDTITTYGIVITHDGDLIAIDRADSLMYRVYRFDNGPDYPEEGLFRIMDEEGNVGFAAADDGRVIIEPRFAYAEPFEGGRALVADDGFSVPFGEYSYWDADEWYYIDREGNRLEQPVEPEI